MLPPSTPEVPSALLPPTSREVLPALLPPTTPEHAPRPCHRQLTPVHAPTLPPPTDPVHAPTGSRCAQLSAPIYEKGALANFRGDDIVLSNTRSLFVQLLPSWLGVITEAVDDFDITLVKVTRAPQPLTP